MRYVEFLDIDVPGAGALGTIEFDPFLAAVASLKTLGGQTLVSHWLDPKPALSIVEGGVMHVRDAASDGIYKSRPEGDAPQQTTALNGQPTWTVSGTTALLQDSGPDVNADAWSIVAVANVQQPAPDSRQDIIGIGLGPSASAGRIWPGLELLHTAGGVSQITVREGGRTDFRVRATYDQLFGQAVVVGSSFSTDQGISAFRNDLDGLVREAGDTRPLTEQRFTVAANRGGGQPTSGHLGMVLVLRDDLTRPEYRAHRDVLIGGLMRKYGIS